MHQNSWSTQLSRHAYTEQFMVGWLNANHTEDQYWPDYESALNVYLASQDTKRPVAVRYASLIDSRDRFQNLSAQGDTHLATRLALIRIHADLGEHQASVAEINRILQDIPGLLDSSPQDIHLATDRPFLAPLSACDARPISSDLSQWFKSAMSEVLESDGSPIGARSHEASLPPEFCASVVEKNSSEIPPVADDGSLPLVTSAELVEKANALDFQEHERRTDLFLKAIGLDRNCIPAYLGYAKEQNKNLQAFFALKEAERLAPLPDEYQKMLGQLMVDQSEIQPYLKRAGQIPIEQSNTPKKILVITNLFPPQEMGGFGRTMWEFCQMLLQRGHHLRVLTADMPHLYRKPSQGTQDIERIVKRNLRLYGDWRDGRTVMEQNPKSISKKLINNHRCILTELKRFRPDCCLVGNLDFLGYEFLDAILEQGIPIVHRLGNSLPGYPAEAAPKSPLYCLAGATDWLNMQLRGKGYSFANMAVIYPASTLETYYRYYPPIFDSLRICFAGLLMPYKGPQIVVQALAELQTRGIPFTCELAGDTTDPSFVDQLKEIAQRAGFTDRLRFTGFLSRQELAALYARSNVMVFPSLFDEPFGKSQIEAMAAGLAVVTSGTGGAREIITHENNGWIFERGNAEDLAAKLLLLHRDPEQAREVAARGHEDAFRFTTVRSVEKIERLFEILTTNPSNRPSPPAPISKPRQAITVDRKISDTTVLVDVVDLNDFAFSDPAGIAVLMPTIDIEKAQKTARILEKRAGIQCRIILIYDSLRQGFIKTINAVVKRIDVKYIVYLAEDAFPGRNWLHCAYQVLEKTGKGLLAFNDGKWSGRTASFGMVRKIWVEQLYDGNLFYPGYKSHAGDDELTMLARAANMFVYEPECTLVEYDLEKDFKECAISNDRSLVSERFASGFDGRVQMDQLNEVGNYHGLSVRQQAFDFNDDGSDRRTKNLKVKVYQIYFNSEQFSFLDSAFEPYDNSRNKSEFYEFAVFRELARSDKTKLFKHWGAVSWRFREKTGLTGKQLIDLISENTEYDFFYFNPEPYYEGLFENFWIQGGTRHPGLLDLAGSLLKGNGFGSEWLYAPHSSALFSSANYFVGNSAFWDLYIPFIEEIFNNAEKSLSADALIQLHSSKADPNNLHHGATYIPFIVERLLPLFLSTKGKTLKALKVALPNQEKILDHQLLHLRKLKDAAVKTHSKQLFFSWVNLRNRYLNNRDSQWLLHKHLKLLSPQQVTWVKDLPSISVKSPSFTTTIFQNPCNGNLNETMASLTEGNIEVTIAIPAYKPNYFEKTLKSAITQDHNSFEIIVCDDCQTEEIREIVSRYQRISKAPLFYFRNEIPLGEVESLSRCIEKARGVFIKPLYDDDLIASNCIAKLSAVLRERSDVALVSSQREVIDANDQLVSAESPAFYYPFHGDVCIHGGDLVSVLSTAPYNFIGEPSSVMYRREHVIPWLGAEIYHLGGELVPGRSDLAMYLKLLQHGHLAMLADNISSFRESPEQVTAQLKIKNIDYSYQTTLLIRRKIHELGWFHGNRKVRISKLDEFHFHQEFDLLGLWSKLTSRTTKQALNNIFMSSDSYNRLKKINENIRERKFHYHTHILYDIRTFLGHERKVYLEIGSYVGSSAALMLSHHFPTDVICIDPLILPKSHYLGENNQKKTLTQNLDIIKKQRINLTNDYKIFKSYSSNPALIQKLNAEKIKIDILFIDGSHAYHDVIQDFKLYSNFVNFGGFIVFDDYWDLKYSPDVHKAVNDIIDWIVKDNAPYEIIGSPLDYQKVLPYPTTGPSKNMLSEFILRRQEESCVLSATKN